MISNLLIYILVLIIIIVYVYTYYPNISEPFENLKKIININLYNNPPIQPTQINTQPTQIHNIPNPRPRVIVPLYSPWRMYYPLDSVYNYNTNMFYPFYDQYNILGNTYPYYNN
jgi:hypothetical protein